MKQFILRSPDHQEWQPYAETSEELTATDPSYLQPVENTWISSDGGNTYIADPEQGVPYDFCITVANNGQIDSGPFIVKFLLSGDQDPALEFSTEEISNLKPGEGYLAIVHYGAFENKFGVYHVQAVIYTPDGSQAISTDLGFDFTINSD